METSEIEFVEFDDVEFPARLRCQAFSFLRVQWPEGFTGENRYRDWITRPELAPHHLLYVAHGLVVSHLEIVHMTLEHEGVAYDVRSPTSVFTFPSFRGEGWGRSLVMEAGRRIDASGADLGIVYCDPALEDFYASCGWTPLPETQTLVGLDRMTATAATDLMLIRPLTDRGWRGREGFLRSPLWIADEW